MPETLQLDSIRMMNPGTLVEAPENPREITSERYAALKYALEKDPAMMHARPIIADARNNHVVCGNMRLRAVKELDWHEVPVYLHKFRDDAERREWMLRDNQEYGNYIPDQLAGLIAQHEMDGADMRLLGFADQELADLRAISENNDLPPMGDGEDDDVPTVYGIVIDCEGETEQLALLEEFNERGLNARALLV